METLFSSPTFNNLNVLSNSIAARDKSVRTIQYGSRLIIGYYKSILSQESLQILQSVTATASHARKIFRLCKSINSLKALMTVLRKQPCEDALDQCCQVLNGFEQLFWVRKKKIRKANILHVDEILHASPFILLILFIS
jgi:hypothetical protein